jgi:hypothetical protein
VKRETQRPAAAVLCATDVRRTFIEAISKTEVDRETHAGQRWQFFVRWTDIEEISKTGVDRESRATWSGARVDNFDKIPLRPKVREWVGQCDYFIRVRSNFNDITSTVHIEGKHMQNHLEVPEGRLSRSERGRISRRDATFPKRTLTLYQSQQGEPQKLKQNIVQVQVHVQASVKRERE